MNSGTKIRTILVIATCLNTALMSTDFAQFHNPTIDMAYRIISVILNFIIVAAATWFNNDYSEEACIGTGMTRQLKAEQKDDYVGERFFTEDDEDEVDDSDMIEEPVYGEFGEAIEVVEEVAEDAFNDI